jgi:DNA-binding response OmpR family regulator
LLCRVNLELEGYLVLEAGTVDEARAHLEAEPVDAVLLDVHVGAESGWALADELRNREGEERVPVALLTGSGRITPEQRARVDELIGKPFRLEELVSTVQRLLTVRSQTR